MSKENETLSERILKNELVFAGGSLCIGAGILMGFGGLSVFSEGLMGMLSGMPVDGMNNLPHKIMKEGAETAVYFSLIPYALLNAVYFMSGDYRK